LDLQFAYVKARPSFISSVSLSLVYQQSLDDQAD
jgi:hypothetical protein